MKAVKSYLLPILFLCSIIGLSNLQAQELNLRNLQNSHRIDLTPDKAVSVLVNSTGGAIKFQLFTHSAVDVSLKLPSGVIVNSQNAPAYNVSFNNVMPSNQVEELHFGNAGSIIIFLDDAHSGEYVLSMSSEEPVEPFFLDIEGASNNITGKIIIGHNQFVIERNKKIPISVVLFDDSVPLINATVSIDIIDEHGIVTESITLSDNGEEIDQKSDDGIYSGSFSVDSDGGYVSIAKIFKNDSKGNSIQGSLISYFSSKAKNLSLTGEYADSLVDIDKDGYFDTLDIAFNYRGTQLEGEYDLTVILSAINDSKTDITAVFNLPVDNFTVSFPHHSIKQLGVDGPYKIESVILWHNSEPLGRWDNVGWTRTINIKAFERKNTLLSDYVHDYALDIDGDGLFDQLNISINADVLIPGWYGISAELSTFSGKIIDDAGIPSINLVKGVNDITIGFTGELIGASGEDGPYILSNVLLYPLFKARATAMTDTLGETSPYSCSQFNGCTVDAEKLLERLKSQVKVLSLNKGIEKSLIVKLENALMAYLKGTPHALDNAKNSVKSFINQVHALRDKNLTRADADMLMEGAKRFLELNE
ncbi:choice-of-anchor X domain-containing protein [Pseudoalteromonas sp. GB56]